MRILSGVAYRWTACEGDVLSRIPGKDVTPVCTVSLFKLMGWVKTSQPKRNKKKNLLTSWMRVENRGSRACVESPGEILPCHCTFTPPPPFSLQLQLLSAFFSCMSHSARKATNMMRTRKWTQTLPDSSHIWLYWKTFMSCETTSLIVIMTLKMYNTLLRVWSFRDA